MFTVGSYTHSKQLASLLSDPSVELPPLSPWLNWLVPFLNRPFKSVVSHCDTKRFALDYCSRPLSVCLFLPVPPSATWEQRLPHAVMEESFVGRQGR